MNVTSLVYNAAAQALRAGPPAAVRQALLAARARTLALADDFERALGPRPPGVAYHPDLNPPIWELGHVGWFQEWWIGRNRQRALGVRCEPDHERAASFLREADAWYDSGRVAHRTRWDLPLPDSAGTRDYLARVLAQTLELLDALPADAGEDALYFYRLVALHEMMHAEAGTYMAQALGIPLRPESPYAECDAAAELVLPPQRFRLGSPSAGGFAFDNELQAHEVEVAAAVIDSQPVSWARYLPFVEFGGYEQREWWSDAGLEWLARQPERLPRYLRSTSTGWQALRAGRWQTLPLQQAAVHLSAHEVDAWCRWAGRRLPGEAEWECAALTLPGFVWGQVWEWTASTFLPFPGFAPHPYRDYSAPWFGTRRVLRGACPATDAGLRHPRYRNFFEPHRSDVFAGFRSSRASDADLRLAV
jgi:iron(II)-dependent oxidoreductase